MRTRNTPSGESKASYLQFDLPAKTSSLRIGLATFILFILNFWFRFPGVLAPDSIQQYQEAVSGQFSDWHPPIMAVTWALLRDLSDGPQVMLFFQLLCHWLGFGLISDGLSRVGHQNSAWLMLFCGILPIFNLNGTLIKDVLMASTLLVGFGLIFWYRVQGLCPPLWAAFVAITFITYGALVRANAVFAFPPLLLYALTEPKRLGAARFILISCFLSAAAIPVCAQINHHLFRAKPSGVASSLQLYDLAGIARQTGDLSVMPPVMNMTEAQLKGCYSPIYWDGFAPWGPCKSAYDKLGPPGSSAREDMARLWINSIIAHPLGYVRHRLKNFNVSIDFFVPAIPCRFAADAEWCSPTVQNIRLDYIKNNPLRWAITWIVVGICIGALLLPLSAAAYRSASYVLLMSGLGYAFAYLFVGVASGYRYFYWSVMAVAITAIIALPSLARRIAKLDYTVIISISFLALMIGAGYFARLTDQQIFVGP